MIRGTGPCLLALVVLAGFAVPCAAQGAVGAADGYGPSLVSNTLVRVGLGGMFRF